MSRFIFERPSKAISDPSHLRIGVKLYYFDMSSINGYYEDSIQWFEPTSEVAMHNVLSKRPVFSNYLAVMAQFDKMGRYLNEETGERDHYSMIVPLTDIGVIKHETVRGYLFHTVADAMEAVLDYYEAHHQHHSVYTRRHKVEPDEGDTPVIRASATLRAEMEAAMDDWLRYNTEHSYSTSADTFKAGDVVESLTPSAYKKRLLDKIASLV
jgi:hypothetical protein